MTNITAANSSVQAHNVWHVHSATCLYVVASCIKSRIEHITAQIRVIMLINCSNCRQVALLSVDCHICMLLLTVVEWVN